jgi:hypothetical protein
MVIGYPRHGGENQQWETIRTENGWHIKSVSSGKYLNLDGHPKDDVRLIVTERPYEWHLWDDEKNTSTIRYGQVIM